MDLGYTTMNTPEDLAPGELGALLESLGYTSLWVGEHPQIPTSRTTPYPAGEPMPVQYRRMMDPFLALAAAASTTTDLRLVTGVALPLEHDVFALAKSVATLDHLSGGRLEFGVGVGWNQEELTNTRPDIPWAARYRALTEAVAALRTLWTDEEAEFHGTYFDFAPTWCEPKPVQRPHPPVIVGAAGRIGTRLAVEWADEWAPMDIALGNVGRRIQKFRDAATEAGRAEVPITIFTWGDPTPDTLRAYRDLGVKRVVLGASRADWDRPELTRSFIERYAPLVDELR